MKISIFGLGYVGTVCAACFTELGHTVIGVDKSSVKVDLISRGNSPVVEPQVAEKISHAVAVGHLSATTDAASAIAETDLSIICVGTPSAQNGDLDLGAIRQVAEEVGHGLRAKSGAHIVIVRSTVLPGTTRQTIVPILEQTSGKRMGHGFDVAFNPEFLREGSAVADFNSPSKTVVGAFNAPTAERVFELYRSLPGAKINSSIEVAEMAKYVDNSWHALKVAFANEIGTIAKTLKINTYEVIDIFLQDTRLNVSSAYLRPGFAFGGSCLPKDVKALGHLVRSKGLSTPVIESILPSNEMIVDRGVKWALAQSRTRIAVLGISFKADTDDVRESPYVALVRSLLDQKKEVRIFDPNVQLSQLVGANRDFLMRDPDLVDLLQDDISSLMEWAEIVILTSPAPQFIDHLKTARRDQTILLLSEADLPPGVEATVSSFH